MIRVGAAKEAEMKEEKDRVEDALNATRASVEEGIVAGGGVAYLWTLKALEKAQYPGDEQLALKSLRRVLEEPIRQIANNTGFEGSVWSNGLWKGTGTSVSMQRPASTKT